MTLSMVIFVPLLYKMHPMKVKSADLLPKWIVYILRCSDDSFYTGATNCLERRLLAHNRGTASKYTRSRRPVILLATSVAMNKGEALRLEMKIKMMPRMKKLTALQAREAGPAVLQDKVHRRRLTVRKKCTE